MKLQKSGDREKVRQQEALLKRQEQEKKEEEVIGVGDHGGGDKCLLGHNRLIPL